MKRNVFLSKIPILLSAVILFAGLLTGCTPTEAEAHEHFFSEGVCVYCGLVCEHDFSNGTGKCSICNLKCPHAEGHDENGICPICGKYAYHDYVDGVCITCGATTNITYYVPEEYKVPCDEQGTVVSYTYHTQNYSYVELFGTELVDVTKRCNVYLPYGYDETEQYNVIYLLHGSIEDENYWLVDTATASGFEIYTTNVFDWLIKNGDVDPFIAVTPDIHTDLEDYDDPSLVDPDKVLAERNADDEYIQQSQAGNPNNDFKFYEMVYYKELRDLATQAEATYAPCVDTDKDGQISDAELIASRNSRALAGFSVGGNITTSSGVLSGYDFIGFFGTFSGGFSDKYEEALLAVAEEIREAGYSIYLFAELEEGADGDGSETRALYQELIEKSDGFFLAEKTLKLLEIKGGMHDYPSYIVALYNALHFFFSEDPSVVNVNG